MNAFLFCGCECSIFKADMGLIESLVYAIYNVKWYQKIVVISLIISITIC